MAKFETILGYSEAQSLWKNIKSFSQHPTQAPATHTPVFYLWNAFVEFFVPNIYYSAEYELATLDHLPHKVWAIKNRIISIK